MAKTVLVIDPAVKLTLKDVRELSQTYIVLRCAPSQVAAPALDADPVTIGVALEMLASTYYSVEPDKWRSYLAKKFVKAARERRGGV